MSILHAHRYFLFYHAMAKRKYWYRFYLDWTRNSCLLLEYLRGIFLRRGLYWCYADVFGWCKLLRNFVNTARAEPPPQGFSSITHTTQILHTSTFKCLLLGLVCIQYKFTSIDVSIPKFIMPITTELCHDGWTIGQSRKLHICEFRDGEEAIVEIPHG